MPAFVTIAFPLPGPLDAATARVVSALTHAGVFLDPARSVGVDVNGSSALVDLGDGPQPLTLRAYDEGGWVAFALDIGAAAYERSAVALGRRVAFDALLSIADGLVAELGLTYCRAEEEAEADVAPEAWSGSALGGVTLLPRQHVERDTLTQIAGVLRVESTAHCCVVLRQLDPVAHHGHEITGSGAALK